MLYKFWEVRSSVSLLKNRALCSTYLLVCFSSLCTPTSFLSQFTVFLGFNYQSTLAILYYRCFNPGYPKFLLKLQKYTIPNTCYIHSGNRVLNLSMEYHQNTATMQQLKWNQITEEKNKQQHTGFFFEGGVWFVFKKIQIENEELLSNVYDTKLTQTLSKSKIF